MQTEKRQFKLVAVSAGTSDPSSTKLLAERIATRASTLVAERGGAVTVTTIDLRELTGEISTAVVSQLLGKGLTAAVAALREADGLIVATPVYKAGPSGLLKSFLDVLDNDLLIARPVVLAATAGTARHALVIDEQLRSLFAYMRTLVAPTSVFASTEDWGDPALNARIDRAALELVVLLESDFAGKIRERSWRSYQHEFGSAGGTELGIDLDSDMMRLATGGSAG